MATTGIQSDTGLKYMIAITAILIRGDNGGVPHGQSTVYPPSLISLTTHLAGRVAEGGWDGLAVPHRGNMMDHLRNNSERNLSPNTLSAGTSLQLRDCFCIGTLEYDYRDRNI